MSSRFVFINLIKVLLVTIPLALFLACEDDDPKSGCGRLAVGDEIECACNDGSTGSQLCLSTGHLSECACYSTSTSGTGGSSSTVGVGGFDSGTRTQRDGGFSSTSRSTTTTSSPISAGIDAGRRDGGI